MLALVGVEIGAAACLRLVIRAVVLRAVALDRLIVELEALARLGGIVVYKILGDGLELDFIFLSEGIDRIS